MVVVDAREAHEVASEDHNPTGVATGIIWRGQVGTMSWGPKAFPALALHSRRLLWDKGRTKPMLLGHNNIGFGALQAVADRVPAGSIDGLHVQVRSATSGFPPKLALAHGRRLGLLRVGNGGGRCGNRF